MYYEKNDWIFNTYWISFINCDNLYNYVWISSNNCLCRVNRTFCMVNRNCIQSYFVKIQIIKFDARFNADLEI